MQPSVPPPPGMPGLVSVKLKPGWAFDAKAQCFTGPKGATFTPDLPAGARLAPTVPQLAGRAPGTTEPSANTSVGVAFTLYLAPSSCSLATGLSQSPLLLGSAPVA